MTLLLVLLATLMGIFIGTWINKIQVPIIPKTKRITRINPIEYKRGSHTCYENQKELDFYKDLPSLLPNNVEYDKKDIQIGEYVKVWNASANYDAVTFKSRHGIDELFKLNGKVIQLATDNFVVMIKGSGTLYNCDLLLEFPTGDKVWINSDLVNRV